MNRPFGPAAIPAGALVAAATFSGAAGLGYEVVWSRMLVVPLGSSADATALVLAAFMLGIAVGARLLGGAADRTRVPLLLYAALEVGLGLYAIAMPFFVTALTALPRLPGILGAPPLAGVARLVAAFGVVFLPALVMGATVPILVRALASVRSDVKLRVGVVYGANTLGAAAGAALTGFVALPHLGSRLTSMAGALFGFTAAGIAASVARRLGERPVASSRNEADDSREAPSTRIAAAALVSATASGFVMLAAEVLWARVLTAVFGHDTYAFAVLLTVVLAGLGFGGLLHRRLAGRDPLVLTGALLGLLAVALLVSYYGAAALVAERGRDPFGLASRAGIGGSLLIELYREILYTPLLVLAPAVVSGAVFPAACALFAGPVERTGARIGAAALVNGVGSALGSLVASFVLVPALGVERAFLLVAAVAGLAAVVVALADAERSSRRAVAIWTPALLALGLGVFAPRFLPAAALPLAGAPIQRPASDESLAIRLGAGSASVDRCFLQGTTDVFDVITVDADHPKAIDSWVFYTREFYELVRQRLAPGGVAVQRVPFGDLSEGELKIIVRTFASVFSEATLWASADFEPGDRAACVSLVAARARLRSTRPVDALGRFLGGPTIIARWTDGFPIQTDDRPLVPFTTEHSAGRRAAPLLLRNDLPTLPLVRSATGCEARVSVSTKSDKRPG